MTLKQAVKILGGASAAAKVSGVKRTVIMYWITNRVPHFRKHDEARIIALASEKRSEETAQQ